MSRFVCGGCLVLLASAVLLASVSSAETGKSRKKPSSGIQNAPSAAVQRTANLPSKPNLGAGNVAVANVFLPWGKIARVSGTAVSASDTSGAKKIDFSVKPALAQNLLVGQKVWINAVQKKVLFVTFPIVTHRKDNLGNSHYMETDVKVSYVTNPPTARIDGKTRTWSKEALRGFTGGVVVFLMDEKGNILYNTTLHKYGVNGEAVPGALSDRTETWNDTSVSKDVIAQTRAVAIVHMDAPTSHWDDFVKKAKDVLEMAKTAVEIYNDAQGGGAPGRTGPTGSGPTEPSASVR